MKTRSLLIVAALLGGCAGFGLLLLDVFGSLILLLITYHLFADGEAARRKCYGGLIAPYWIFIIVLYTVIFSYVWIVHAQSMAATSNLILISFGAILGLIVYGLKKLFRAYASKSLKQSQPLEG